MSTNHNKGWSIRSLILINLVLTVVFMIVIYVYVDTLHTNSKDASENVVNKYADHIGISRISKDNMLIAISLTGEQSLKSNSSKSFDRTTEKQNFSSSVAIKTTNSSKLRTSTDEARVNASIPTKPKAEPVKKTIFSTRKGPRQYFYENDSHVTELNGSLARHYLLDLPILTPLVILFYADWCPHCRQYAPVYKNTAARIHQHIEDLQAHYHHLYDTEQNAKTILEKKDIQELMKKNASIPVATHLLWTAYATTPLHIPTIRFTAINCAQYKDLCSDQLFHLTGYPRMIMFHFRPMLETLVQHREQDLMMRSGSDLDEKKALLRPLLNQTLSHLAYNHSFFIDMETIVRTTMGEWLERHYFQYFPQ